MNRQIMNSKVSDAFVSNGHGRKITLIPSGCVKAASETDKWNQERENVI